MTPEGDPHARRAGENGRRQKFKGALTTRFWQPLPCKHLLPCIGWFDILPLRLGVGGGSSPCENPHPRGPLSHVWVSIVTCFFFPLFFLFHIFVVVFVSAPASTSIRALSLSLSLSLTSTSRCLVYLSSFWVRLSSSISANKAKTCAKLTAP